MCLCIWLLSVPRVTHQEEPSPRCDGSSFSPRMDILGWEPVPLPYGLEDPLLGWPTQPMAKLWAWTELFIAACKKQHWTNSHLHNYNTFNNYIINTLLSGKTCLLLSRNFLCSLHFPFLSTGALVGQRKKRICETHKGSRKSSCSNGERVLAFL